MLGPFSVNWAMSIVFSYTSAYTPPPLFTIFFFADSISWYSQKRAVSHPYWSLWCREKSPTLSLRAFSLVALIFKFPLSTDLQTVASTMMAAYLSLKASYGNFQMLSTRIHEYTPKTHPHCNLPSKLFLDVISYTCTWWDRRNFGCIFKWCEISVVFNVSYCWLRKLWGRMRHFWEGFGKETLRWIHRNYLGVANQE